MAKMELTGIFPAMKRMKKGQAADFAA